MKNILLPMVAGLLLALFADTLRAQEPAAPVKSNPASTIPGLPAKFLEPFKGVIPLLQSPAASKKLVKRNPPDPLSRVSALKSPAQTNAIVIPTVLAARITTGLDSSVMVKPRKLKDTTVVTEYYYLDPSDSQWNYYQQIVTSYDQDGHITLQLWKERDESANSWFTYRKWEKGYDARGNCILEMQAYYDYYSHQLSEGSKYEWSYDSKNQVTSKVYERIDYGSQEWKVVNRSEITWYESVSKETVYITDPQTGQWIVAAIYANAYDDKGRITESIYLFVDLETNEWFAGEGNMYRYDSRGNLVLHENHSYTPGPDPVIIGTKTVTEYNVHNQPVRMLVLYTDYNQGDTFVWRSEEYVYDNRGNQVLVTSLVRDEITGKMTLQQKTESVYDGRGNLITTISYWWNADSGQLIAMDKKAYTFDTRNHLSSFTMYRKSSSGDWIPSSTISYTFSPDRRMLLLVLLSWNRSLAKWEPRTKIVNPIDYSPYPGGLRTAASANPEVTLEELRSKELSMVQGDDTGIGKTLDGLTIFPNPASDYVVFEVSLTSVSPTIELFDLRGKCALSGPLPANKSILVGDLPKGVYVVRLTDGERVHTGKVLVQ